MARKRSPLLDALLLPTVQQVLAATILQPDREWYLSDLAGHLGTSPSSLQRTLRKLTDAGILLRRGDGGRVYYRPDPDCPILPELTGLVAKTIGVADRLRDALLPLAGHVEAAFVHGSVAEARERSESDVDLIVIGDPPGVELAAAIRPLNDSLGRPVNVTRYSADEFLAKAAAGHPFLSKVLKRPRIFVIGNEQDLERLTHRPPRRARALEQTGAR
jgi:DNA-binding transcriptional ArsR family regulator